MHEELGFTSLTSRQAKIAQLERGEVAVSHQVCRLDVAVRDFENFVKVVQPANDPGHQAVATEGERGRGKGERETNN